MSAHDESHDAALERAFDAGGDALPDDAAALLRDCDECRLAWVSLGAAHAAILEAAAEEKADRAAAAAIGRAPGEDASVAALRTKLDALRAPAEAPVAPQPAGPVVIALPRRGRTWLLVAAAALLAALGLFFSQRDRDPRPDQRLGAHDFAIDVATSADGKLVFAWTTPLPPDGWYVLDLFDAAKGYADSVATSGRLREGRWETPAVVMSVLPREVKVRVAVFDADGQAVAASEREMQ